jgi:hypothetical protein
MTKEREERRKKKETKEREREGKIDGQACDCRYCVCTHKAYIYIDVEKDHANARVLLTTVHDIITNGRENRRILAAHALTTQIR